MSFNTPIKPANDIEAVRRSAFWHLGRRDHSEQELRNKLARKTDNQAWIETVITECYEYNYLNDQRFVESFIRTSNNKGYGANRIKRDLKQKGIATDLIQGAFTNNQYDYVESAVLLLAKKYDKRLNNQSVKQKAMGFLQNKGHSFDDIFAAIDIHNETLPEDDCDYLSEAITLLSRKFKDEIKDRKTHDKATRFLLTKGYQFSDIKQAIQAHNQQLND